MGGLVVGAVNTGTVDEGGDAVELMPDARVSLAPSLGPGQLQQRRAAVLGLVHVLVLAGGSLVLSRGAQHVTKLVRIHPG